MTGLEGNRQIYLPRKRFRIDSPRVSIDRGAAEVNRDSWGGDPEGPVIVCFIIPLCYSKKKNNYFNLKLINSTMGLITKNTYV